MALFDDIERTNLAVPRAEETKHGYLNLSARPAAQAVRDFLTEALDRYPGADRQDLMSRLRSIDGTHDAAVFELAVHELLIRTGHTILAVEPRVLGKTTRPDFLVRAPDGSDFVVECVVTNGLSNAAAAAERRLNTALDAVSTTPSPQHILSVKVRGAPAEPITLRQLRHRLRQWIAALPDGDEAKQADALVYEEHGLRLTVIVMARRRHPAEPGDRSVGSIFLGVRAAQPGADLRASLLKKANRYGDLGKPYVIAVNEADGFFGERHLMDALLGSPVVHIRRREGEVDEVWDGRADDGIWTNGRRARKRGISAVLYFSGVSAWRPWGRLARLVRNPWASYPLPELALTVPQLNPGDDEFVALPGEEGPNLFGLDEDWPAD